MRVQKGLQVGSRLQFNPPGAAEISREGRRMQIALCTLHEASSGFRTEPVTGQVWVEIATRTAIQQPLPPEQFEQIVECQIPILVPV